MIDVFICNLRKKLDTWGFGKLIDTVRGHGYIMRDLSDVAAEVVPLPMVAAGIGAVRAPAERFAAVG